MFLGDVMHTCILGCIVDLVKTKFMGSLLVLAAGTVSRSSGAGAALMGPLMTCFHMWSIRSGFVDSARGTITHVLWSSLTTVEGPGLIHHCSAC